MIKFRAFRWGVVIMGIIFAFSRYRLSPYTPTTWAVFLGLFGFGQWNLVGKPMFWFGCVPRLVAKDGERVFRVFWESR